MFTAFLGKKHKCKSVCQDIRHNSGAERGSWTPSKAVWCCTRRVELLGESLDGTIISQAEQTFQGSSVPAGSRAAADDGHCTNCRYHLVIVLVEQQGLQKALNTCYSRRNCVNNALLFQLLQTLCPSQTVLWFPEAKQCWDSTFHVFTILTSSLKTFLRIPRQNSFLLLSEEVCIHCLSPLICQALTEFWIPSALFLTGWVSLLPWFPNSLKGIPLLCFLLVWPRSKSHFLTWGMKTKHLN